MCYKLYRMLKSIDVFLFHGACLDGGVSSYLFQKYGGVAGVFKYIPPGQALINELLAGGVSKIALVDVALPSVKNVEILSKVALVVDHHLSSAQYVGLDSIGVIYKEDESTAGIIWSDILNFPQMPMILHAINKGDLGRLSKDTDPELFYIYIGLQSILELNRRETRNDWTRFPNVLGYLVENERDHIESIKQYGILKFLDEYGYVLSCLNEKNVGNLYFQDKVYRCIFISARSTVTSLVAGKTLSREVLDIAIMKSRGRFSLRALSDVKDVDLIANELDPLGGGHAAASSAEINVDTITNKNIFDHLILNRIKENTIGNPVVLTEVPNPAMIQPITAGNLTVIGTIATMIDSISTLENDVFRPLILRAREQDIKRYKPTKLKATSKVFQPMD
ncbi:MAG: hypothetical protein Harvfovirus70_4 [Harvfovirus sp.]|uniref:DHH family phosphohydrolase n=1 Tax=Harvfovirus sp. TaxID=2487768 RepID=A0A3G5A3Q5_9VIRU|nr:MAG: hypothetical protein Harvfovirus70_4 [Harvfovirus sp.]